MGRGISLIVLLISIFSIPAIGEDRISEKVQAKKSLDAIIDADRFGLPGNKNRYIDEYIAMLGEEYLLDLAGQREGNHIVDGGSGNGKALESFYSGTLENGSPVISLAKTQLYKDAKRRRAIFRIGTTHQNQKPNATGITFKGTRPPTFGDHLYVFIGKFLEAIPPANLVARYGLANLITDVYGVLAYTSTPDVALNHYLTILAADGAIYAHNAYTTHTVICSPDGQAMSFREWMETISDLTVEEMKPFDISETRSSNTLRIKPKTQTVRVPPLEVASAPESIINPPQRVFRDLRAPKFRDSAARQKNCVKETSDSMDRLERMIYVKSSEK